jgi:hypothetical protein
MVFVVAHSFLQYKESCNGCIHVYGMHTEAPSKACTSAIFCRPEALSVSLKSKSTATWAKDSLAFSRSSACARFSAAIVCASSICWDRI